MAERRVFECLCLDPSKPGYSYDSALLVDVDRAFDFDEAVIRLTTKCNSIVTQFRTLGHCFSEFSVAASKVYGGKTDTLTAVTANNGRNKHEVERMQSPPSNPEMRNLRLMDVEWRRLKKKNYSGMVAVARVTRSSIPRNGAGGRYSVKAFTEAVLGHIQAYFMFQSYCPEFERWVDGDEGNWNYGGESPDDEYLLYLAYRIRDKHTSDKTETLAQSPARRRKWTTEVEKLELGWPAFVPNASKRRRRNTSGESSLSSCSSTSTSSTPSGGPTYLTPPAMRSLHQLADRSWRFRTRSGTVKTPEDTSVEWETASAPPSLSSPVSVDDENNPFQTPVSLRSRTSSHRSRTRTSSGSSRENEPTRYSPRLRSRGQEPSSLQD